MMQSDRAPFRISQLPAAARVLLTGFALLMGVGYLISLANLYFTYADADGRPGVSAADLKIRLHGNRSATLLESVIAPGGKMAPYLPDDSDRQQVLGWIRRGARETEFAAVRPVFQRNCVRCHSAGGLAAFRPLTDFRQVAAVTHVDEGESPGTWARIAHTHIQGMGLVYLALGLMFVFCGFGETLKAVVVAAPFALMVVDFAARGLVRFNENLVYGVLLSGLGIGLVTVTMILGILWELWIRPAGEVRQAQRAGPARAPEPMRPVAADHPAALAE